MKNLYKKSAPLAIFLVLFFIIPISYAKQLKFAWQYNRYFLDNGVVGFKLYMGVEEGNYPTLVADISKAELTAQNEKPILLKETFDTDPGTKYNVTRGSWSWVEKTKNMKIESDEFMVVFEYPAGTYNDMSYFFWPEKGLGDQAQLYSYIKDEAQSTNGGVYYELRFGSLSGIRYSNWRKVYDQKYGGVHPDGAYPLPRFEQCDIAEEGETLCPGNYILMTWTPEMSCATVLNTSGCREDVDERPLDINKLEIILKEQTGWIDNIVIGGQLEVVTTTPIDVDLPQDKVYFAATAYNDAGESEKSVPVVYEAIIDYTKMTPKKPNQFRKLPNASQTN